MTEWVILPVASIVGLLLGAIFFGGLWWTIDRSMASRRPALWFLGSFAARMSIAMAGFYLLGRWQWQALVACLMGFVIARLIVTWLTRASTARLTFQVRGTNRAA